MINTDGNQVKKLCYEMVVVSQTFVFIIPGDQYWKIDWVEYILTVTFPTQLPHYASVKARE